PAALVGGAFPALQADAADAGAFRAVEQLGEGVGVASLDLRGGAAHEEQPFAAVGEDGQGAPALELQLGVVDWSGGGHRSPFLSESRGKTKASPLGSPCCERRSIPPEGRSRPAEKPEKLVPGRQEIRNLLPPRAGLIRYLLPFFFLNSSMYFLGFSLKA